MSDFIFSFVNCLMTGVFKVLFDHAKQVCQGSRVRGCVSVLHLHTKTSQISFGVGQ